MIDRLRKGATYQSDIPDGILQRYNIHIAVADLGAVDDTLKALSESPKTASAKAKFILATDGEQIGSATPRLADHPERQKLLWARTQPYAWETGISAQFFSGDEVLERLDYVSYFELTDQPLSDNRAGIFGKLSADRLIEADVGGN